MRPRVAAGLCLLHRNVGIKGKWNAICATETPHVLSNPSTWWIHLFSAVWCKGAPVGWCHGQHQGRQHALEHRGSSDYREAQWPAMCRGKIGPRLLPCPPVSSHKARLPSLWPAHCWRGYVACETPAGFSAQHHAMMCSCIHRSWFPLQPAICWKVKELGFLQRGSLSPEGSMGTC